MRSHYCLEVCEKSVDKEVSICGWVHNRRDHGGVIFLDIRDSSGILQVVYEPENQEIFKIAEKLRHEYVVALKGRVRYRPDNMINTRIKTGKIELVALSIDILNSAETPPFLPDEHQLVNEDVRYRYRYLDLRRDVMQANLRLRHKLTSIVRD
jgi:aspartyl-tRNA synthetase